MAAISGVKVAQAAHDAGFRDQTLVTMVAIARAESGWDPRAHNAKPPDNSFGLWQINMIGALGPERRKLLGIASNDELFDPATNARAAKLIHKQQGFEAWSVFLHDTFKAHLDQALAAVQDAGFSPGTPMEEDMPLTSDDIKKIVTAVLDAPLSDAITPQEGDTKPLKAVLVNDRRRLDRVEQKVDEILTIVRKLG
jgi:Lysozyme like domain